MVFYPVTMSGNKNKWYWIPLLPCC